MAIERHIEPLDNLNGYKEIAAALGITIRQAKHRVSIGAIPILRQGRCVMARRSSIKKALPAQEREAR